MLIAKVSTLVGLACILLAGYIFVSNTIFLKTAISGEGYVSDLIKETHTGSRRGTSVSYHPKVVFTANTGETITFTSLNGSSPSNYAIGDMVPVLYQQNDPSRVKIHSFFDLWLEAVISGILGSFFLAIGCCMIFAIRKKKKLKEWLLAHGKTIETDYKDCKENTVITLNGRHPYAIRSQWQNPADAKTYTFESENIWYDPSSSMISKKIKVYVDPQHLEHYYMDISFLPEEPVV